MTIDLPAGFTISRQQSGRLGSESNGNVVISTWASAPATSRLTVLTSIGITAHGGLGPPGRCARLPRPRWTAPVAAAHTRSHVARARTGATAFATSNARPPGGPLLQPERNAVGRGVPRPGLPFRNRARGVPALRGRRPPSLPRGPHQDEICRTLCLQRGGPLPRTAFRSSDFRGAQGGVGPFRRNGRPECH